MGCDCIHDDSLPIYFYYLLFQWLCSQDDLQSTLHKNGFPISSSGDSFTRGYQKVLSLRHFPHSDSTMLHT